MRRTAGRSDEATTQHGLTKREHERGDGLEQSKHRTVVDHQEIPNEGMGLAGQARGVLGAHTFQSFEARRDALLLDPSQVIAVVLYTSDERFESLVEQALQVFPGRPKILQRVGCRAFRLVQDRIQSVGQQGSISREQLAGRRLLERRPQQILRNIEVGQGKRRSLDRVERKLAEQTRPQLDAFGVRSQFLRQEGLPRVPSCDLGLLAGVDGEVGVDAGLNGEAA
jgi:hypothetical protein